jgi:hypothetical protein
MHRWMRIFAALFWFFWAGVVVPGHTRGVIQLEGKGQQARCCHTPTRTAPCDSPKPSVPTSKNCAICFVAAKLGNESLPPPDALKLPFAYTMVIPDAPASPALQLTLPFQTRGPPDSSTANT